jgi:hypothetical protein
MDEVLANELKEARALLKQSIEVNAINSKALEKADKAIDRLTKEKKGRGKPLGEETLLCNSILNYCRTILGDNGDEFIQVKHPVTTRYNGVYSFAGIGHEEQRLDDVITQLCIADGGTVPTDEQLSKALGMYLRITRINAPRMPVARRVGHILENGAPVKYVDRGVQCDSKRFIRIDATHDMELVDKSDGILFLNEPDMLVLPKPDFSATYEDLVRERPLNIEEDELQLAFAYQLQLLLMQGNFVNLSYRGPTRSGKTIRAAFTQHVLQPYKNFQVSEGMSKNYEDILLVGMNTLSICYDNISSIDKDQSDTLCRMSTGARLRKRKLYTDKGMAKLETKNPLIFTSVYQFMRWTDLLGRTFVISVPPRADGVGDTAEKLEADFRRLHPLWLGALCNAASGALRHIDEIRDVSLGDMASFAKWMIAAGIELGDKWSEANIFRLIDKYSYGTRALAPVLELVRTLLEEFTGGRFEYQDSMKQLLTDLRKIASMFELDIDLPANEEQLSRMLNNSRYELFEHDILVQTGIKTRDFNRVKLSMFLFDEDRAEKAAIYRMRMQAGAGS